MRWWYPARRLLHKMWRADGYRRVPNHDTTAIAIMGGSSEDHDNTIASSTAATTKKTGWSDIFWVGTGVEELGERPQSKWWGGRDTYVLRRDSGEFLC